MRRDAVRRYGQPYPVSTMRATQAVLLCCAAALVFPAAASAARGTLDYRQALDSSRGTYAEGAFSYVSVSDARGQVVLERAFQRARFRLRHPFPAGRYRVTSFQRPCAGNCAALDPPTDSCARRLEILPRGRSVVRVTVRPGRGCRMGVVEQPALFPPRARLAAVRRYLRSRGGVNSWALVDSRGRLHGFAQRRRYHSASVVKAMLLVAYLRRIGNRRPTAAERRLLGPMITVSDNARATAVYHRVGDARLRRLARRVGMRNFTVSYCWGCAFFSAADQARFFYGFDRLVPPRSRRYARRLLSSIVAYQRWGFSRYSLGAGFRTFFKGGWRGTGRGQLVHEAAMFERGRVRFSMAVLTDGNPGHAYGTATLRGVAARIFGRPGRASQGPGEAVGTPAHRRAGLVDIQRFAPGILTDLVYRTKRNITGRRLPGYCREWALMLRPAARDLARVQRYLRRRGLGLLVLDAYRPARATRALVRWAERTGRGYLVGTYIARRSNHNLGSAVDLTVVRRRDGHRLRMGRFDALRPGAHTLAARGRVLRNRLTLKRAMERFGFTNYWREWWHYDHRVRGSRYLDLTLGCGRGGLRPGANSGTIPFRWSYAPPGWDGIAGMPATSR
jgi:D-alanyl-D-alanine dipeptidase